MTQEELNNTLMTQEELDRIIEDHQHYLKRDCEGWESMKARIEFRHLIDLTFRGADLTGAYFHGVFLDNVSLESVKLEGAYFSYSYIRASAMNCADLTDAAMFNTALSDMSFSHAKLIDCELNYCTIIDTTFYDADLTGSRLRRATMERVNFIDAKNVPFIPMACPDTGAFIGYKKAYYFDPGDWGLVPHECIVKLQILEDARRSSATTGKCRCDKAKVLDIQNFDGDHLTVYEACSAYDKNFKYRVGEIVQEPRFDEDRWRECAPGIHFFVNRQDAVNYIG